MNGYDKKESTTIKSTNKNMLCWQHWEAEAHLIQDAHFGNYGCISSEINNHDGDSEMLTNKPAGDGDI